MQRFLRSTRLFGILAVLVSFSTVVSAQSASSDSTRAYWKLYASQESQSPLIRFYTAAHQVVYEETLPKDLGRLTQKNIRLFDQLLASVTNQRLVSSHLSPERNLAIYSVPLSVEKSPGTKITWYRDGVAFFVANPQVKELGKIQVFYARLDTKQVSVSITDELEEYSHYQDRSNRSTYRRSIDLQKFPSGRYKLMIRHPGQTFTYYLLVDRSLNRVDIQPQTNMVHSD
ncbi:hypothetical protein BWI93_11855 [Siphonobacter sp. BAB-5385]|uniref:hypothetical protein n=1 Tax=Siphonobacter sp. BAB-5385 TaxID=1864822 RepID=UPI000B9EE41C|nr:hypothetical protein [Siphonobacter sp. BAB-5385]OZI07949.1 hypothetical protein BWI93_11855 [Siphonobacter sp. BAB-5385]